MNEKTKLALIDEIIANYYECGYETNAAPVVIDAIFTIISYKESDT